MSDETKSERIQVLFSPSELAAIDDWGFSRRIRSRSHTIRRLSAQGLAFDALLIALMRTAAELRGLQTNEIASEEDRENHRRSLIAAADAIKQVFDILPEEVFERVDSIKKGMDALKELSEDE